jgi:hypothetical protein
MRHGQLVNIIRYNRIDDELADRMLVAWGHWLKGCSRPFGRVSSGLFLYDELVAVAVSASTVNASCGGYPRQRCVELARLCAHPQHRDLTRVALRCWRVTAASEWPYWLADVLVSYQNAIRHTGDIYRFDGWIKVADTKGSTGGGTWSRPRKSGEPKAVWAYPLAAAERERLRDAVAVPSQPVNKLTS